MKKTLLAAALTGLAISAQGQIITDTVALGAGYANQIWYSFQNDEQGTQPKSNWDVAFETSQFGVGVFSNSPAGVVVKTYHNGGIAAFGSSLDTTGLSAYPALINTDENWSDGAFNQGANNFDVGWGQYDGNTHIITGDSIFIIKLADGRYKQLALVNMASGTWNFKMANLNGDSIQIVALVKAGFITKNLVYYNLRTNTVADREPAKTAWDLSFQQYGDVPLGGYTVTGVLTNNDVAVAVADGVADKNTYVDYNAHAFADDRINYIGWQWKMLNNATFAYDIKDSQVYFVRTQNNDIWKLVFRGFVGSSAGRVIFTKERLFQAPAAAVAATAGPQLTLVAYPNPAAGQDVTLVYDLGTANAGAALVVTDIAGRPIYRASLSGHAGLRSHTVPVASFPAGMYMATIETSAGRIQQKIIVR